MKGTLLGTRVLAADQIKMRSLEQIFTCCDECQASDEGKLLNKEILCRTVIWRQRRMPLARNTWGY